MFARLPNHHVAGCQRRAENKLGPYTLAPGCQPAPLRTPPLPRSGEGLGEGASYDPETVVSFSVSHVCDGDGAKPETVSRRAKWAVRVQMKMAGASSTTIGSISL